MFVAWRDLRYARGRFALVVTVVGLITTLVVLLSGLTAGLGRDSTSAITGLAADQVALSTPTAAEKAGFGTSSVTRQQWQEWAAVPGVTRAEPVGISTTRATGDRAATVTVMAVPAGSRLAPGPGVADGSVVLSTGAAEDLCGDRTCESVELGSGRVAVAGVSGDASYSHLPVIWSSLATWQAMPGGAGPGHATAIALTTAGTTDLAAADTRLGTVTMTPSAARAAVGSYTSENGSLQLMRALLFGISALVVGAFFTVWTMQRTGDVAVLRAMGASTGYVLRDALAQSALVLLIGVGLGAAVGAATSLAARSVVPFVLDLQTVAVPVAVTILLGLAGAALSVVRVTRVDPLIALGGSR
jgi:putative ABC transport system permease protein